MNYSQKIKNIKSIEELQTLHNEMIIRSGYFSILGREVDQEGLKNHLSIFRKSMSIEEFILELKNSPENKLKNNFVEKNNTHRKDIRKETNEPTSEMLGKLGNKAKYLYLSLKKESQNLSIGCN